MAHISTIAVYKTALDALDFTYVQCRKEVELLRNGAGNVAVLAALLDRTIPTSPADCALAALVQHLTDRRNAVSNLFKDRLACLLLLADASLVGTALVANDVIAVELVAGHYTVKRVGAHEAVGAHAAVDAHAAVGASPRQVTYRPRDSSSRDGSSRDRQPRDRQPRDGRGRARGPLTGSRPNQQQTRTASIGLTKEAMDAIIATASAKMRDSEVEEFPLPSRAQSTTAQSTTAQSTKVTAAQPVVKKANEDWTDIDATPMDFTDPLIIK